MSSSSWGCELKYDKDKNAHMVSLSSSSWGCELKYKKEYILMFQQRHPLREDVSWNIEQLCLEDEKMAVILFVRMWVEISCTSTSLSSLSSSSSWGCELKYRIISKRKCTSSHPLREDVSWNISVSSSKPPETRHPLREDVSWNDPDRFGLGSWFRHPLREDVSWNIEDGNGTELQQTSSSSWGCELK